MTTTTLESAIAYMLPQGDIAPFRRALASRFSVSLEAVDAAIAKVLAKAGPQRAIDPEDAAQWRLREERRYRHTAAARAFHHEEE